MTGPLFEKLRHGVDLTAADLKVLDELCAGPREIGAHEDLIAEGDDPGHVRLVVSGFCCRYKLLDDGSRSIMALMVPGDFCDLHIAILGSMDHSIATLTPAEIVFIPHTTINELTANHPRIARAFWWATLVDEGILREWLVNIGQRPAAERMAHLFCELLVRLQTVGLAQDNSFQLPVTQQELAEILGLSSVHVNRVFQQLKDEGLIERQGRTLHIRDLQRLKTFSGFHGNYLHLSPRGNAKPSKHS